MVVEKVNAREEILAKIGDAAIDPVSAHRAPGIVSARGRDEILKEFAENVAEYRADVSRIRESELASQIGSLLAERLVAVPDDLPRNWIRELGAVRDSGGLCLSDLDQTDAVVTGCALGIAETGTVVLDAGFAQGPRRLTLVPDQHVIVIFESQVVESVAEAISLLQPAVEAGRPLTFISGPSATSDIELSRVEGVHGPRKLAVLLVQDPLH